MTWAGNCFYCTDSPCTGECAQDQPGTISGRRMKKPLISFNPYIPQEVRDAVGIEPTTVKKKKHKSFKFKKNETISKKPPDRKGKG